MNFDVSIDCKDASYKNVSYDNIYLVFMAQNYDSNVFYYYVPVAGKEKVIKNTSFLGSDKHIIANTGFDFKNPIVAEMDSNNMVRDIDTNNKNGIKIKRNTNFSGDNDKILLIPVPKKIKDMVISQMKNQTDEDEFWSGLMLLADRIGRKIKSISSNNSKTSFTANLEGYYLNWNTGYPDDERELASFSKNMSEALNVGVSYERKIDDGEVVMRRRAEDLFSGTPTIKGTSYLDSITSPIAPDDDDDEYTSKKEKNILRDISPNPPKYLGESKGQSNGQSITGQVIDTLKPDANISKQAIGKYNKIDKKLGLTRDQYFELLNKLKKTVRSQDQALEGLVKFVDRKQKFIDSGLEIFSKERSCILIDGPTGTGKTFMAEELSKELGIPLTKVSTPSISAAGYSGADLTGSLVRLLEQAKGDIDLAQRGIVVFDEIDKLRFKSIHENLNMHEAIQQELLPFLDGSTYEVKYNGKVYKFDTTNLTKIGLGAFQELRESKIEEVEKSHKPGLGFYDKNDQDYKKQYTITDQDYIDYGMKRELVGRFSIRLSTKELGIDDLEDILRNSSKSPIKRLEALAMLYDGSVKISDDLIHQIAVDAFNAGVGARGLDAIYDSLFDIISDSLIMGDEVSITPDMLEKVQEAKTHEYYVRGGKTI